MTLDEILAEQIKRLPPNLRAELQTPRRDNSRSLLGGGIGLSRAEPTGDTYPPDFAGRRSRDDVRGTRGGDVIVQGNQAAPSPAVRPQGMDENALVRQAGFAAANSELAPLLSDWRTSPAAALTAAIGGYGRGSYAAQRDLAAGRAEAQKAEREAAQIAARDKAIADLPPEMRALAAGAPDAVFAALVKAKFPEPIDPAIAAQMGQSQQQFEATMGFNQQKAAAEQQQFMAQQELALEKLAQDGAISQEELALRRSELAKGRAAPETFQDIPPEELKARGLPPGTQRSSLGALKFGPAQGGGGELPALSKLIAARDNLAPDDPNRKIYDAAIEKETTRSRSGLTVYDTNGNPIVTTGSAVPGAASVTQAGQNKISEFRSAREASNAAIKDYKELVAKTGGTVIPGTAEAAALDAARTRAMMGAKKVYELGAPTGPDIELLGNLVPSASGLAGVYDPVGRVDAGLQALEKDIESLTTSVERGYGGENAVTRPAAPAPAPAPALPPPPVPAPEGYGPGQTLPAPKAAKPDDLTYFGFGP